MTRLTSPGSSFRRKPESGYIQTLDPGFGFAETSFSSG